MNDDCLYIFFVMPYYVLVDPQIGYGARKPVISRQACYGHGNTMRTDTKSYSTKILAATFLQKKRIVETRAREYLHGAVFVAIAV